MDSDDDDLDRRIDGFLHRLTSARSHFVGLLCFWSMCMLSVSFWKAALLGFFATGFMVLQLETRIVTIVVLALAIAGSAAFIGVSIYDVKRMVVDLHLASG
jgi:hypothetical protein